MTPRATTGRTDDTRHRKHRAPWPGRRGARLLLVLACLIGGVAALVAQGTPGRLSQGGWTPETAPSMRADALLASGFRDGAPHLVMLARATESVDAPDAAREGQALTERLAGDPRTAWVHGYWPDRLADLRTRDKHWALVTVRFRGDEQTVRAASADAVARNAKALGPLTVSASGETALRSEVERLSSQGVYVAEFVAAPLVLLILLWAFGSLVAALLPVLVGGLAVVTTMACLRLLTEVTTVSAFALNITSALGFGLAVDYSLLLINRYREELAAGARPASAVQATLRSAGRAVGYSAATVATSLCSLVAFPLPLLRSLAYGGTAVVLLSAAGALVVLPALLLLLGTRVNSWDIFSALRRPPRDDPRQGAWYRIATWVTARPVVVASAVLALLVLLAAPASQVRFGAYDERILPSSSPVSAASRDLRTHFGTGMSNAASVVLPGFDAGREATALEHYAERLSAVPHVRSVDTTTGTYRHGRLESPPGPMAARFTAPAGTWLSVVSRGEAASPDGSRLARRLRGVPGPGDATVLVGGAGARLADTEKVLTDRLPAAVGATVLVTFLLLLAYTRSVLIPVKALVLNTLSLAATFGLLVAVFQQGLGSTLYGGLTTGGVTDVIVPGLMFCVAFGLSMDYEVFLLSRIVEEHRRGHDTPTAVALGLQHTGRLFTSAALVFAVVMASLALCDLVLLKLVGAGLAVAVMLDCTVIRALLVPAVMRLAGRANWWLPSQVRREQVPVSTPG